MPTGKVDATENSNTSGKVWTSNSRNSGRSRNFEKHRNEEQSEDRLVRKTPEHRKEPELPEHRRFDSSRRYPGTFTSGRRRVGGRCRIGDRNRCPLKGSKTQSREPEEVLEMLDKGRQAETSAGLQLYGGGVEKWEQAERRSDLKEEASDLERQVMAAKTQESAREERVLELSLE
jgi:hypothetical protein